MILSESVEIRVINNNKKYLLSRGYDISNDIINIKVEDLPKGSKKKILVKCDICNNEKIVKYYYYNKSIENGGYYSCSSKCSNEKRKETNVEKYGTEWASQSDEIKNRIRETNIDKYGVSCSLHNIDIMEKTKETNIEKYGTEWASQSMEVKNKIKETNIERYGTEWAIQSDEIRRKIEKTNIERYGVSNPMKNINIFNKSKTTKRLRYDDENYNNRELAITTNIERYGVSHFPQSSEYLEKSIETNIERYGVPYFSMTDDYKESVKNTLSKRYGNPNYVNLSKIKETNIERYGTEWSLQSDEIRRKIEKTNIERYGEKSTLNLPHVELSRKDGILKYNKEYIINKYGNILPDNYNILEYNSGDVVISHDDHEFICTIQLLYDRLKTQHCEVCTKCNPINSNSSSYELEISEWLRSLGMNIINSDRTILGNGQEIDILIPDKNIGIEFNGLYWHSDLFKSKYYHLNKTKLSSENGIDLIHIFEDDWIYKKDIVKSIITNRLGISSYRIFGRKCSVRNVELNECKKFLNDNHIQGYARCKYKIGLYYKDELISVMTFGSRSINSKKEFELIRFCNKMGTNVIGSASKLFKYFINNYNHEFEKIISYADISMFSGDIYHKLGFEEIHLSKPNYYWIVDGIRHHRFKYNKQKLINKLNGDPNKTESEIMNDWGNYKIWSCGQLRFEYNKVR